ncbi:hypothetical protein Tco_0688268 [Tanacetum coccineum]
MVTTRRNSDDDVPNFEAMIAAAVANALPNLTAALRTQITNDIRNGAESSGGSGGGGDATPQGIHVWIERFTKLKPLAFRSAATPAEAEDWITHMEKLFQVLGCPDNFKTRLAAFKLEGDALSWYFPTSEQQRYEREYGSIYQLDQENSGEYMERFTRLASFVGTAAGDRLPAMLPVTFELLPESVKLYKRDRDGNRIQNRGQGQQENRGRHDQGQHEYRGRLDRVCASGPNRIGVMIRDDKIFGVRIKGLMVGSANQRRSTETLPPPPLCTTCECLFRCVILLDCLFFMERVDAIDCVRRT